MDFKEIKDKNIIIFVPHQDDEINIAGGLIYSLSSYNNIKVVFTTNGDFIYKSQIRYKEAIASLKKLNIKKQDIIFLGYSDQPYDAKNHMYNSENNWISIHNEEKTSGITKIDEWCYKTNGIHRFFSKANFTKDIKDVIFSFRPDIIICIDLDFHPDHIMTSLSLEKAIGEILNETHGEYKPIVLKTFAYENAYLGKNDFNDINDYGMIFKLDHDHLVSNPYYSDNNKVCFTIDPKCYSKNLFGNPIWKAIKCHKSQLLIQHAFQIINSNNVFWIRDTDNALYDAEVTATSGNSDYLHDFLLCDTNNVLNGNVNNIYYNEAIWIPDNNDDEKEIKIQLKNERYISYIKLYNGRKNEEFIKNIAICFDNDDYMKINFESNNYIQTIRVGRKVKKIRIKVLDNKVNNGFSEIELIEETMNEIQRNYHNENNNEIIYFNKCKIFRQFLIKINIIILKFEILKTKIIRKAFINPIYKNRK